MSLKPVFGIVLGAVLLATTVVPAWSQPTLRTLTEQEVVDLLTGSSIQAARGSDTEGMIRRAQELLAEGKRFTLIALEDLPDDWRVVSAAGGLGGGGAWDHVSERMERQRAPTLPDDVATLRAMDVLAAHLGTKFDAIIRNEPSGGTLAAFVSATARGLPVVDACLAGRCKPEVQMQMPVVRGVPPRPAVLVTRWGDTVIIDKTIATPDAWSCWRTSVLRPPCAGWHKNCVTFRNMSPDENVTKETPMMKKPWQRRLVFSSALVAASIGLAGCSDDSNTPAAKTAEAALGIQPNKQSSKKVETTHDVTVIQDTKVVDSKTGEVISEKKDVTPVRVTQEKQVKTDVNVKVGETKSAPK